MNRVSVIYHRLTEPMMENHGWPQCVYCIVYIQVLLLLLKRDYDTNIWESFTWVLKCPPESYALILNPREVAWVQLSTIPHPPTTEEVQIHRCTHTQKHKTHTLLCWRFSVWKAITLIFGGGSYLKKVTKNCTRSMKLLCWENAIWKGRRDN